MDNKPCVDHINNNQLDNNISNLRWCTQSENCMNASMKSNNSSGVKGISFHKIKHKWQAIITINGLNIHLGYYETIEEATIARVNKVNQAFGIYKNACEGIQYDAKPQKIRKAKPIVKPIIEPVVVPKVDVHQIFNKIKQLHENYESKKIFINNNCNKF